MDPESEPRFDDKDEAIRYWKQLAEERKNDFEELEVWLRQCLNKVFGSQLSMRVLR